MEHGRVYFALAAVLITVGGECSAEPGIRLVNGQHSWEGRVEVYLNGQWGTVCDDDWDNDDAEVVCRQLGLQTTSAQAISGAHFGQGTSNILLDEVRCTGSESRLADCDANSVGVNDCSHNEDAGVYCSSAADIRLVDGQHTWEGRVEVYLNGQWGTVCDDSWDNKDAEVVCRQLGLHTTSAQAFSGGHFGQGSSDILLDEVRCTGSEFHLADCNANPVGDNDCGHNEDAGVSCDPAVRTCNERHALNASRYYNYIYSPNYPNSYPSLSSCQWIISAPYYYRVALYVMSMDLECRFDTLYVYDGNGQQSLLGRMCDPSDQRTTWTSTGRYMTVAFRSDGSTNKQGFQVRYTAVMHLTTSTPLPDSDNGESYSSSYDDYSTPIIVILSVAGCVFLGIVVGIVACCLRCKANQRQSAGRVVSLPPPVPLHSYAPGPAPSYAPDVGASVYSTPSSGGVPSPAYAYRAPPPAYDSLVHGTPGVTSDHASLNPGHSRTGQVFDNPAFSAGDAPHFDNPAFSAGNPSHPDNPAFSAGNPSHLDNPDKGQDGATPSAPHAVSDADPTVAVPPDSSACLPAYSPQMAFTHPPNDSSQL